MLGVNGSLFAGAIIWQMNRREVVKEQHAKGTGRGLSCPGAVSWE